MQRRSRTTCHEQTETQPVAQQWSPWKNRAPRPPSFFLYSQFLLLSMILYRMEYPLGWFGSCLCALPVSEGAGGGQRSSSQSVGLLPTHWFRPKMETGEPHRLLRRKINCILARPSTKGYRCPAHFVGGDARIRARFTVNNVNQGYLKDIVIRPVDSVIIWTLSK